GQAFCRLWVVAHDTSFSTVGSATQQSLQRHASALAALCLRDDLLRERVDPFVDCQLLALQRDAAHDGRVTRDDASVVVRQLIPAVAQLDAELTNRSLSQQAG